MRAVWSPCECPSSNASTSFSFDLLPKKDRRFVHYAKLIKFRPL